MDSLSYKYNTGTNQLNWVKDNVGNNEYRSSNSAPYDIEDINNQSSNNYTYDQIGNLVSDAAENITTAAGGIKWNVYGKITEINKATSGNGSVKKITYTYDASGNRISKKVERYNSGGTDYTFYIRDASGNTMSVYTYTDSLRVSEQYMYGSSRLGNIAPALNLDRAAPTPVTMPLLTAGYFANFTRGNKFFELSNHLGNVLVTLSDKKKGVQNGTTGSVLYYLPIVKSASDYYPFGMKMPGRSYTASSTNYRFGFNGKEEDDEVKGEGNQQDYGMRIYDTRLGRFLSVDPLTKDYSELTPYQFASNTPIQAIDLDGLERLDVTSYDSKKRTASLQIIKNTFVNSNNIASQVSALSNTTFQSIFSSGNTTVYVREIPVNGQSLQTISKKAYKKGNGFKLNVSYNVTIQNTTNPASINLNDNVNALVENGSASAFPNPLTFARATTNNTNLVSINPNFIEFNPPVGWSSGNIPSYEELVAHEIGFHVMARLLHTANQSGNAIYPTDRTLESNLPGQIRPNMANTLSILNGALINNNFNDPNLFLMRNIVPLREKQTTRSTSPGAPAISPAHAPAATNNLIPNKSE